MNNNLASKLFSFLRKFKVLVFFQITSFVSFWYLASLGTFTFSTFSFDGRSSYFMEQAVALLHGKWGVDPIYLSYQRTLGLSNECFQYHHECLGYFGLTPSIIRIPEILLFGPNLGIASNCYLLLAMALSIFFVSSIYFTLCSISELEPENKLRQFYFGAVMLFSPLLFFTISGEMYYEAILWGITFLLGTFLYLLKFKQFHNSRYALLSIFFATCAINSRINEGIAAFVGCFLLFTFGGSGFSNIKSKNLISILKNNLLLFQNKKFLILSTIGFLSFPIINYFKFGVIIPSVTRLNAYIADPAMLATISRCGEWSIKRVPTLLADYIIPNFRNWPFSFSFYVNHYDFTLFNKTIIPSSSCINTPEPMSAFSTTYPFTFLLAMFGLVYVYKNRKLNWVSSVVPLLFCGLVIMVILSGFLGSTERYVPELLPMFLLLAFYGTEEYLLRSNKLLFYVLNSLLICQAFTSYTVIIMTFYLHTDRPNQIMNLIGYNWISHFTSLISVPHN